MDKKIKLIHKLWNDHIILDFKNNRLNRVNTDNEYGSFILKKNIIEICWDNWNKEIFISYKNDNFTYYFCEEVNFVHTDWESICYIDYINNFIIKKDNNLKGQIEFNDSEIIINWENKMEDLIENDIKIDKIPNIIHFIFGFKEQVEEFDLYRYIAIKSAYEVNNPDKIYFYYYYEPYGYWWNKIKPLLTLEKIELHNEIYGNKLYHYAHKADVIRLQKLIEHGGIYLDMDTICLCPFTHLLEYDFVMGTQINSDDTDIYGLCNAVILSKPNSLFAIKWLESYKTFRSKGRDKYWDEHSVLKPLELSGIYPTEIKILSSNAFFYPLWYKINDILFNDKININEYKKIIENNFCIHLWDTYSNKYLKKLNEKTIFTQNTLYNIFARKFLKNKISIVMLTYNRNEKTEECLNSYLNCLDNKYIEELIILDNNSNNDLIRFLKNFQKKNEKIRLIFSHENLGVSGGRSILFDEAIGDIIISIDSDAYLINNSFFEKIIKLLYNEKIGIVGISGAYIKSWNFGTQQDIDDKDENEYVVDHIAGCCQAFRKDLSIFGFKLDLYYGKFWVEDTDLSMQSLALNKINYRISQKNFIEHHWGGSGKDFADLFLKNWNYFTNKWKGKVLNEINNN